MMTFCKKSVHSFLSLAATTPIDHSSSSTTEKVPCKCNGVLASGGLGLITVTGDINRSHNVVESSTIKPITPPSSPPPRKLKDPGGIGFLDDIGGGVDGLMSCTESLGFESSDERRVDEEEEIDQLCSSRFRSSSSSSTERFKRKVGERREIKKFPPPLSSLNHNGQPSFFLRPVRKDGRLELTEVRIERPEILRASRQDGRLRLHLIRDEEDDDDDNDNFNTNDEEVEPEQEMDPAGEEEEVDVEEESEQEWVSPVTSEGFRRCHELLSHHNHHHHHHHHHYSYHHHNLHEWSQHCVTSR
ncbi:DUF3049 domain-containing protein [Cephalotus follicularis]|uniref:DUF3049 domain-containing protein n=1 Tax=Cephalotus follicularis TaxID=3775 RepID=A0A1Q3B5E6_CEPFO|nr:DUF3049 domain-containing protein [Cephalotus follicularis]